MKFPTLAVIVFAVSSLASLQPTASAAIETKKMNVLFIISDDLRAELGSYGAPQVLTPNLDRLAAQGVRFDRSYCQYPLCGPSRTSMLTGRHPTTTKIQGNRNWFGATHPEWTSLPKYFRQQGYVTLRSGKIFHEGLDDTDAWVEGGEARYFGEDAPGATKEKPATAKPATAAEDAAHVSNMIAQDRSRASKSDRWEATPDDEAPAQGDTVKTDKALELLRQAKTSDKPFFLAFGLSKPHSPLIAPKRFFDLYKTDDVTLPVDFQPRPTVPEGFPVGSIRPNNADLFIARDATPQAAKEMILAYRACVSYMDWNVGRVLTELEKLGLRESTIVVFWGDNGYQLGEKGKWSKAGSLWEQGARVPLMIYDPRAKGNGTASPRIVQAIDIYPTLVELCGLPPVSGLDGLSLKPLLENPKLTWNHPAYTIWNERSRGITGVVVRTEQWRYAEFFGRGAGAMLTDPINDPAETKNLVTDPQHAAIVKDLSGLAQKYVAGQTEPAPRD
jgi:arylsulfatase A-like enzyme